MAQLSVPSAPKEYTTHYQQLLGVDFQADQTQVDRRRSPDMVNMISDFGGNPIKRDGYRKVSSHYDALVMVDGVIYGIESTSLTFRIVTLELDEYLLKETATVYTSISSFGDVHGVFVYQQTIYTITDLCMVSCNTETGVVNGVGIGEYDGVHSGMMSVNAVGESEPATDQALNDSIPDVVIGLKPDGTGGTVLDNKNIFSIYQRVTYYGDGVTTAYKIPNYTKMGTWFLAEKKNSSGEWEVDESATAGASTTVKGKKLDGSGYEDNNIVDTTVTFSSAPLTPTDAGAAGEPSARITYCPFLIETLGVDENSNNLYKGYYNETLVNILKSPAIVFQNGRMFMTDRYKVYYSDVNNPYMVSDLSWFDIDSEVVAFTRSNSSLVVLAKDNGKGTIYLANEETRTVDSEKGLTETYYVVKESNAGIGAVASKAVATLSDEPLFLSASGIYGLLTNYLSDKYAVNRSSRINRKLCKEANLENAVAISFNDYFYLAVNGRMYVLDGRHKESDRAGNKPFEAYYFEGLPAIEKMWVVGGRMYFCDDESVYTWNDDLGDSERYYDTTEVAECVSLKYGISDSPTIPPAPLDYSSTKPTPAEGEYLWYLGAYLYYKDGMQWFAFKETTDELHLGDKMAVMDAGNPVACKWCSIYDDDGAPQRLKTLMKKGTMVTLVPYFRSSCEVTIVKDGDVFTYLPEFDASLQSFDLVNFGRGEITFNGNPVAFDDFTKKKIKKYKRLQIQLANNKAEPFGITQITKTFTIGNYAKR